MKTAKPLFTRRAMLTAAVSAAALLGACSSNDSVLAPGLQPTGRSSQSAFAATNPKSVLILANTVVGGTSPEATAAANLGMTVTVVNDAQWASMTAADFASYRAIILGDPNCQVGTSRVAAADANKNVWGPVVNGNVFIIGSDPVDHGKVNVTNNGVAFATAAEGKTGAYITLSCYYAGAPQQTASFLSGLSTLGSFVVQGSPGCFNDAYKTADSPSLTGLTSAYLSNWGCSVHEVFNKWPSDFDVLVIARGLSGFYTAPDGTQGTPYVLARGQGLTIISDIQLTPASETSVIGTTQTLTATVLAGATPVAGKLVTFTVTDGPDAGVTASSTTDAAGTATFTLTGNTEGTDGVRAQFTDSRNLVQSSNRSTVAFTKPVDASPPVITHVITGTHGTGSWFTTPPTVTWTVVDAESPVTSPACAAQTISTNTASVTVSCSATSAGGTVTDAVVIMLDTSVPTVSPTVPAATGANGWYTSDIPVSWTVGGAGPSGIVTTCPSTGVSAETTGVTLSCTATTGAGLSTTVSTPVLKLDKSAPSVSGIASGPLHNGWYTGDVTVNWSASDKVSGVNAVPCAANTLSSDNAGITYSCTATNGAGLHASASVSVRRDATNPLIAYSGNAGTYTVDQAIAITCAASDAMSGLASSNCAPIGGNAYSFGVGTHSYSATATDGAGNSASATAAFTVSVTQGSLCSLVERFVSNAGVANSLCVKLSHGDYDPFRSELSAQSGKKVSADNAALLLSLVNALSN